MQEEVEVDKLKLKTQTEKSQTKGDDGDRVKSGPSVEGESTQFCRLRNS